MTHNIAVDIGTSGVRMAIRGRGVVYRQSAAIAWRGSDLLESGNEALRLSGRVPPGIEVSFPMRGGLIADERALTMWLRYLMRHAQSAGLVHRPRLLLAVAPDIQPAPLRHMVALALESGAVACSVVRGDVAAAIGAPMDIHAPKGALVCQLGAGMMSVTAIAGGRIAASRALPYGMGHVDAAIVRRLRKAHGMVLGERTAEDLKLSLASASAQAAPCASVAALDAKTGFPRSFEVQSADIQDVAEPMLGQLCELIHCVLSDIPHELTADLADGGLIMTGGGAQLFGLPLRLADAFSLPCHLVDDPSACVVRGLNVIMDAKDKYDALITTHVEVMQRGTA